VRLAAIYDIHGNLPALEAVLEEIKQADVDRIVVGGDVVPGPLPQETIGKLLDLKCPIDFIHGNGELAVLQQFRGEVPSMMPEQVRPLIEWTARHLSSEYRRLFDRWPRTIQVELPPLGKVMFCHATPRNELEVFTAITPAEHLEPIFVGVDASIVVCGHTHMQFDRMVGDVRIVNAGSVGMPFGKPGAYWLMLGPDIEFRRTQYDLQKAAARVRQSNYPQAEQFATNNILNPPSEEQMLEVFKKVEI
jgi:predicted phosphodiesterase